VATIRADQEALVSQAYQGPVTAANTAVASAESVLGADESALSSDQAALSSDQAALAATGQRLSTDRTSLAVASVADAMAQARLRADRARLRDIAVSLYTDETAGVPAGDVPLSLVQDQMNGEATVTIVFNTVVKDLAADVRAATAASQRLTRLTGAVATDSAQLHTDQTTVADATSGVTYASASMTGAEKQLRGTRAQLVAAVATQRAAVAAVVGSPAGTNALSVMGPSALNAAQLAGWFTAEGYVDLTPASIEQLASWYVALGATEGIRGDVAFAQAILETGGFTSPDAVNLNNYAGIGHCDTCAAGWKLPSPRGGVLGQLQLLRVFADSDSAPGLPAPVLPAFAPANEQQSGCCQTWQSLTGVWATDPAYASKILSLYQQMLTFALSDPAPSGTPEPG
jgi:flagellum-specific peptidoglycan hydrolase FlgJ